ncbi:HK97 gp10 family phage protein [Actinomadura coerulea]|uniref:HK97 gp10 family phage protein n=1 Tax=Actinomadura coerulea TaxID=46159 RepID=A0A7X0G799_9ACTN|nr:HK97 gp10 family phage protein [Actinomadura coerulea]MBB6400514.1 HK97 gp10 family phage protein [Actinomadura coerulea]GGQ07773.1 hypothetical protein GCM10010187_24810 [Actinomadura coerulea]
MARVTMRIDNRELRRISRRLDEVPERIKQGAHAAVEESGEAVRSATERTVGVHSGRLKRRVRMKLLGRMGLTADVGWFDSDTYYARFPELGTSSITANPVLTRAAEAERPVFPRRVQRHIEDAL